MSESRSYNPVSSAVWQMRKQTQKISQLVSKESWKPGLLVCAVSFHMCLGKLEPPYENRTFGTLVICGGSIYPAHSCYWPFSCLCHVTQAYLQAQGSSWECVEKETATAIFPFLVSLAVCIQELNLYFRNGSLYPNAFMQP